MEEVAEDPRSAAGGAPAAGMLRDARTPPKSWSEFESPTARWANPFVLRVGQVFTGFGVGCGVGIGVGRPVNLGALPAAGAVASMAGDFNRLAAGAAAPLRPLLRRMGVLHVDVGVGCGVGFGHGFGAGIALKPQVLASLLQSAQAMVSRLISHIPEEHRSHATAALSSSMPALGNSTPALSNSTPALSNSTPALSNSTPGLGNSIPALGNSVPALISAAEKRREGHGTGLAMPGSERTSYSSATNPDAGGAYLPDMDQTKAQNLIMLSLLEQQADIRRLTQQVQALQEQENRGGTKARCFDCRQRSRRRTKGDK